MLTQRPAALAGSPRRIGRPTTGAAFALPNALWALAFFVAPFAIMLVYSFAQQDPLTAKVSYHWTTQNYGAGFFHNGLTVHALLRSLWMSALATVGCVALGYPLAYFLAFRAGRLKPLLLALVIVPFWTSFVVRTYAWLGLLGIDGTITQALLRVGIIGKPTDVAFSPTAIVIGIVYNYLPLMVFPIFVALDRIEPRVLEAARDLGASGLSTIRRVIVPQGMPGLLAGIIIVAVPATGEYVVPAILGGDKTLMFGNVIGAQFGTAFNWPLGAALASILTAILLVVVATTVRLAAVDGAPR